MKIPPPKNPKSKYSKEVSKAHGTLVHIRYWSTLDSLTLTFCPNTFLTSICILYKGSHKKLWAKNPMKNFSPWHRILRSPLKWDFWKGAKMRRLALPWNFLTSIYNWEVKNELMGQTPNRIFFCFVRNKIL